MILLGMIKPDKGKVTLFGKELNSHFDLWNDIGYLVETPYSYPNLSVKENLEVYYKLRQHKQPDLIDGIIEKLKLTEYQDKKNESAFAWQSTATGISKGINAPTKVANS